LEVLIQADCKVDICTSTDVLGVEEIQAAIGTRCDGAIGQVTEEWGDHLFAALKAAGGM
jgi:hydroxypyruvate reductase 1